MPPALPSALARLGSLGFFLLELQGELEVSGNKHGQLVDSHDRRRRKGAPTDHTFLLCSFMTLALTYMYVIRQADTADRSSSPRGKDRQLVQAAGRVAVRARVPSPPTLEGDQDGDGDVVMQHGDDCNASEDKLIPAAATTTTTTSHATRTLTRRSRSGPTPIAGLSAKT